MRIIPAIDIRDGRCVRLRQGRASDETVYNQQPENVAREFYDAGASKIHLVDLDGAFDGESDNGKIIERVISSVPVDLELGGSIRSLKHIEFWLKKGINQVILGTVAVQQPDVVRDAVIQFGADKIIVGIDTDDGKVATHGWRESSNLRDTEFAGRMCEFGVVRFIYTAIHTDGMLSGPAFGEIERFAKAGPARVTASGGVRNLEDLSALQSLEEYGVDSVIAGRSIYERTMDLREAVTFLEGEN